ncbi:MAG: CehA/McbA family metallohydrolase [Deltaproteobacteria bacterium]|nr:CehA/McbA family metallohydrolase [Deltaproteobacteria bacterium]
MSLLLALVALLVACAPEQEPFARAFVIEDRSQLIGGPKALASPGDWMLENDRIRIAVLDAGYSPGPSIYGGSVVDADLQRYDPAFAHGQGADLFAELFCTANMNLMEAVEPGQVEIVADGSDGGPATIRVTAGARGFLSMLDALWALVAAPDLQIVTDYVLEPGVSFLRIRTTVTYGGADPQLDGEPMPPVDGDTPLIETAISTGLVVGDFFLSGGSTDVFAPGIGFDEGLAVFEAYEAGRNLFLDPFVVDYLASAGSHTSYGYASVDGPLLVPMFTSNQTAGIAHAVEGDGSPSRFPAGTAWTSERVFSVGDGDIGSALDGLLEARHIPRGEVVGRVTEATTGRSLSGAHVFAWRGPPETREGRPWAEWRTDVGIDEVPDGSFGGDLPSGTWTLAAHLAGRPEGRPVQVEVVPGDRVRVALELPLAGQVEIDVVDEVGRPVPAKVSLFATSGSSTRNTVLGDGWISGGASEVLFSATWPVTATLPTGEYTAVASRGPEYELGRSRAFLVSDHETTRVRLLVIRSVDTTGFVAADLHVHCDASFDAEVPRTDRVVGMAAEGVEFFTSNDHDILTIYAPTVDDLGLEPWLRTEVGVEVTPLELGHFLGFPLSRDPWSPTGGAFGWDEMEPEDILEGLRGIADEGVDPFTTVAHPRDGILGYFDQFGLDPYASDDGDVVVVPPILSLLHPLIHADAFTLEMDAVEVFNSKRMELIRTPTQAEASAYAVDRDADRIQDMLTRTLEEQEALADGTLDLAYGILGQVDDWFTLLNLGYRHTAVGSSDSHSRTGTPAGWPRTYVASETDQPAYLETDAVLEALRAHRAVVTYGPFIRFEADGEPVGSEIVAHGPVSLHIQVQAPTWFDVDHVELYENGTLLREWTVDVPPDPIVRFDEVVEVEPSRDAWYVVVANGPAGLDPALPDEERPYIQLQDVVIEALSPIEALSAFLSEPIPRPRAYPMVPYALTNPIWVDVQGDGWTAPGLPDWLRAPPDPSEQDGL